MNQPMSIPPSVWGPFFWHTIHLSALGYSVAPTLPEKRAAKEFYESLQYMIPCPICKTHYAEFLKKFPITPSLDNRTDLFRWTVQVHNAVNESLGKRSNYTEADAIRFYATLGARGRSPVYVPEDYEAANYYDMMKGAGIATLSIAVVAALGWYVSKKMSDS
jgi:hypothetical protein